MLNFDNFEGNVCDELWLKVGESMEPKEICYMHQALHSNTGTFNDSQLVKSSIINTLLAKLSQVGVGHFADPIRLGTMAAPAKEAVLSQRDYLGDKLQDYFLQEHFTLDKLKALYQAIIAHNALINHSIIRGFFEKAPEYRQQMALKTIAELSVNQSLLAEFLMSFAEFIGVNKESRNSFDHTALIEKIYDCARNNYETSDAEAVKFLLNHGCQESYLNESQCKLFNTIMQPQPTRQKI